MTSSSGSATPWLWADERYRGKHGIGRYATEILDRLSFRWAPLGLRGKPGSPLDVFQKLPRLPENAVIYSPGYGSFVRTRRPQIATVYDLIHLQVDWPGRAKYLAYYNGPLRAIVRRTGMVLTVSETSKAEIQEWLKDDSVEVVNAGIGCSDLFRLDGPTVSSSDPYCVYVGNLRAHKNLDVVFQAVAANPTLRLKAVLPVAEIPTAQERIAQLNVGDRIEFLHGIDDEELAALYRGAAVTVMPSLLEGFGLPPLESIRCGTPVVYWAGCGVIAETVGDRGWAVDQATDPTQWSEALGVALAEHRRVDPPPESQHDWAQIATNVERALLKRAPNS